MCVHRCVFMVLVHVCVHSVCVHTLVSRGAWVCLQRGVYVCACVCLLCTQV